MTRTIFQSPSASLGHFRVDPSLAAWCVPLPPPTCFGTCSSSTKQTKYMQVNILCWGILFNQPDSLDRSLAHDFFLRLASKCFDIPTFWLLLGIHNSSSSSRYLRRNKQSQFLYPYAITCRLKSDLEIWIVASKLCFTKIMSIVVQLLTKIQFSSNLNLGL